MRSRRSILTGLVMACIILAACSNGHLPPIKNSEELVRACSQLASSYGDGPIPVTEWPIAVRKLNPKGVERSGDLMFIMTYQVIGRSTEGYVIDEKESPQRDHYVISNTSYRGIYSFDNSLW